ncbi:MAG: nuclear transport factor 2 family protein [Chthoniobacterales bacterium]
MKAQHVVSFLLASWLNLNVALAAPEASPAAAEVTSKPAAAAAAVPAAPDAAELTKLLNDFLAGASRNDVAMHDRFWADDLIYTGSSGRRIGKADLMRDVREEAAAPEKPKQEAEVATYSAEDIRIQQYGATAIVAFRLVGSTKKGEKTEVANYLNTGTFLKRDDQWRAVSWQATKMPAPEPMK